MTLPMRPCLALNSMRKIFTWMKSPWRAHAKFVIKMNEAFLSFSNLCVFLSFVELARHAIRLNFVELKWFLLYDFYLYKAIKSYFLIPNCCRVWCVRAYSKHAHTAHIPMHLNKENESETYSPVRRITDCRSLIVIITRTYIYFTLTLAIDYIKDFQFQPGMVWNALRPPSPPPPPPSTHISIVWKKKNNNSRYMRTWIVFRKLVACNAMKIGRLTLCKQQEKVHWLSANGKKKVGNVRLVQWSKSNLCAIDWLFNTFAKYCWPKDLTDKLVAIVLVRIWGTLLNVIL